MSVLLELVVDEQASHGERSENQAEEDVAGVGAVMQDAVALADGQGEHQDHNDQIESLVHKRSFPSVQLKNARWARGVKLSEIVLPI